MANFNITDFDLDAIKAQAESFRFTVEAFYLDFNLLDNRLAVLDVLTGVGKTAKTIQFLYNEYNQTDFNKTVYAARTIQEVLEALLGFRRRLIEGGKCVSHANRLLTTKGRLSFNFDGSKASDLAKIKELLSSSNWTPAEKKWIKTLVCSTNKYEVMNRFIFSTHANIQLHSELYSDYSVIFDELPTFTYQLVPTKKTAADLKAFHIANADMSGEAFIDPNSISLAIANGLMDVSDITDGAVVYHINPNTPFKRCIILTAFAQTSEINILNKLGKDIKIITPVESSEQIKTVNNLLNMDVVKIDSISNKDTAGIRRACLAGVYNPSQCFEISTSSQIQGDMQAIRTNKTGTNSLSHMTEAIVVTQLNHDNFEKSVYTKAFGEIGAADIKLNLGGGKILQSLFRGCIRKGEKMHVVLGSRTMLEGITSVLKIYKGGC